MSSISRSKIAALPWMELWCCKSNFIWFLHRTSGPTFWHTFRVLTMFLILITRLTCCNVLARGDRKPGLVLKDSQFPNFSRGVASILLFFGSFGIVPFGRKIFHWGNHLAAWILWNWNTPKEKGDWYKWYPWLMRKKLCSSSEDVRSSLLPRPLVLKFLGLFYVLFSVVRGMFPGSSFAGRNVTICHSSHEISKSVVSRQSFP